MTATLLAGLVPFVALAVHQLHAAGKLTAGHQLCMALFLSASLLGGMTGVALRYYCRVMPQSRNLNTLLNELGG